MKQIPLMRRTRRGREEGGRKNKRMRGWRGREDERRWDEMQEERG